MRVWPAAILVIALIASCGKPVEKPGVDFEVKNFKAESPGGCVSDTVSCAAFEVEYPTFAHLDSAAQKAIRNKINYVLGGSAGEVRSLTALGNDFIRDFDQFTKEMPGYGLGWYFKGKVSVLVATDTLISLQVDVESFTGGAHSSFTTNYINIEPVDGTDYLLDSMLKPGYRDELNKLGRRDLLRQLGEGTEVDEAFALNENYGFKPEGVVFFFNDYEIASYAEGPTEILIPYEELTGWFR